MQVSEVERRRCPALLSGNPFCQLQPSPLSTAEIRPEWQLQCGSVSGLLSNNTSIPIPSLFASHAAAQEAGGPKPAAALEATQRQVCAPLFSFFRTIFFTTPPSPLPNTPTPPLAAVGSEGEAGGPGAAAADEAAQRREGEAASGGDPAHQEPEGAAAAQDEAGERPVPQLEGQPREGAGPAAQGGAAQRVRDAQAAGAAPEAAEGTRNGSMSALILIWFIAAGGSLVAYSAFWLLTCISCNLLLSKLVVGS